jgi:hypothetical protein
VPELTLHLSKEQARVILDALYDLDPASDLSMELVELIEEALGESAR